MMQRPNTDPKTIQCTNCGHHNNANQKTCIVCAMPLPKIPRATQRPKTTVELTRPTKEREQSYNVSREQPSPRSNKEKRSMATPQQTSSKCPDCGHSNRVGDLFCVECGAYITSAEREEKPSDITQEMQELNVSKIQASIERDPREESRGPYAKPRAKSIEEGDIAPGCFQFTNDMHLRFTDIETGRYSEIVPSKDKPMLLGRSHESLPIQPDVDLTPFLTEKHGVSRRHALIRRRDLRLEMQDLNSTNGTGINGYRFRPKETHQIRSGDVITLGRVSIRITFLRKVTSPRLDNVTDKLG